jgi:branched-chain amino acid transport system permease protein
MKGTSMLASFRAPTIGLFVLLAGGWFLLDALDAATVSILVLALYYAVAGTSFNFLYGSLGVFSLAQPVFLAVGGYTGVYLYNTYGISPWISLFIAPVVAAVVALPVAFASVRAGGGAVLTALITLIISQAVPPLLIAIKPLGGAVGMYVTLQDHPKAVDMQFADPATFGQIFLVINVVLIAFLIWWRRSRLGYFSSAVRDSEIASAASGVPNSRMKIIVFCVAAMIAAPAGVVYAQYNLLTTPDLFLGPTALFQVIVVALVGGSARPWGTLIGSVIMVYISKEVSDLANGAPGIGPLTFAFVFVIIALIMPRGISGTWNAIVARRRGFKGGGMSLTGAAVEPEVRDATPTDLQADPDAVLNGHLDEADQEPSAQAVPGAGRTT